MKGIFGKVFNLKRYIFKRTEVAIFCMPCPAAPGQGDGFSAASYTMDNLPPGIRQAMERAGHWRDAEMERRRRLGDYCYAVFEGPQCVHYSWVTGKLRILEEAGLSLPLGEKDCWIYNCFTDPSFRGRSIYSRVLKAIARDFAGSGGRRVWIDVEMDNQASVRGIIKAGFKEAAVVRNAVCLSMFSLKKRRWTGGPDLRPVLAGF